MSRLRPYSKHPEIELEVAALLVRISDHILPGFHLESRNGRRLWFGGATLRSNATWTAPAGPVMERRQTAVLGGRGACSASGTGDGSGNVSEGLGATGLLVLGSRAGGSGLEEGDGLERGRTKDGRPESSTSVGPSVHHTVQSGGRATRRVRHRVHECIASAGNGSDGHKTVWKTPTGSHSSSKQMDGHDAINGDAPAAAGGENAPPVLSKSARKKLLKKQRMEARKAERKAAERDRKRQNLERRRREWEEMLAAAPEEERARMVESRLEVRRERIGKRAEEREAKTQRLRAAAEAGQKVVVDLEFADLMTAGEIHSLVQQIMYCYAVNGRSASPAHLWLTGCKGELETQLQRLPGFDKWIIEKEHKSYVEALQDRKDDLVYLTADSDNVLDDLDPKKIYIIGGLVDRNRWKGLTLKKAKDQGIQSAKLPIANYLKMSSSQVLTVNQVVEILLKFLETRDWMNAFFQVIPQRKRGEVEAGTEEAEDEADEDAVEREREMEDEESDVEEEEECILRKKQCIRGAESEEAEDASVMVPGGVEADVEGGGCAEKLALSRSK